MPQEQKSAFAALDIIQSNLSATNVTGENIKILQEGISVHFALKAVIKINWDLHFAKFALRAPTMAELGKNKNAHAFYVLRTQQHWYLEALIFRHAPVRLVSSVNLRLATEAVQYVNQALQKTSQAFLMYVRYVLNMISIPQQSLQLKIRQSAACAKWVLLAQIMVLVENVRAAHTRIS